MNTSQPLHTLHDGTLIRIISAKELKEIPVWKGNRLIDTNHVKELQSAIGSNVNKLDSGYRIVHYYELDAGGNRIKHLALIDGQHRQQVLKHYYDTTLCEPDFEVLIYENHVSSEEEIIILFNELNNSKPIQWSDPNMMVNKYIKALTDKFNKSKKELIRNKTRRPYLEIDSLRSALLACSSKLTLNQQKIQEFVERVVLYNYEQVRQYSIDLLSAGKEKAKLIQSAADAQFMLALDPKLPWVLRLL